MTFAKEWDDQYRANAHMSIWPWSDLVAYVHRHAKPSAGFGRVLELGCGAGANIPFFKYLGVDYSSVEGSETAVARLRSQHPDLAGKIVQGDFTVELPVPGEFDLVVDRSSLISNTTQAMTRGLALAVSRMRRGGRFIAIDWFSDTHYVAKLGEAIDSHTRHNFPEGSELGGLGPIHFCDKAHLIGLLEGAGLAVVLIEHKTSTIESDQSRFTRAWWNLVAEKR